MISLESCYQLLDSKLSLITIGESKVPNFKWKEQQTTQLSKEQFRNNYINSSTKGVGIVTGYNNVEVIDIDTKILPTNEEKEVFWREFLALLKDNIEDFDNKIAIYKTLSGGYHLIYKCKKIDGNLKVAKPKGFKEALIETRGIGGYVFIYTENLTNLTYTNIKEITEHERSIILECCKFYDFIEDTKEKLPEKTISNFQEQSTKTWDDYNNKHNVLDVISDQFTIVGEANGNKLILRHGSKAKHSGYIFGNTGKLFLYSTGTEYPHEKPLSPFDLYTYRYCGGDYRESASKLYKDGYGSRIKKETVPSFDNFWFITKKGLLQLDPFKFKKFLENNNFQKFYPSKVDDGYSFIKKDGNFIEITSDAEMKDFVLKYLYNINEIDVWNLMASRPSFFSKDFLSMVNTSNIEISKDTKDDCMLYYKNKALKITKDTYTLLDYDDLNGYVWKSQIIDRDIVLNSESEGVFKTFIWLVSGQDVDRYYTLKSVIGYLLHSYQNESKPKAIIFNDEMISDDVPNGGSGKGLIHKAIGHIKNIVVENGKKFDPRAQFAYQKVDKDTQIFLMDDVPKNFNFENLFSIVTEGMTVEKKGKDAFQIPFKESPKLSITTNYTVKGDGASHYRRVFEVEIANYFNDHKTPYDEFGHQFFSEWNSKEWQKFDNFMIRCIQFYLNKGLLESKKVNLEYRKFKDNLGNEFIEFMDAKDLSELTIERKTFRDDFIRQYPNIAKFITPQNFNKKVKEYCNYYNVNLEEKKYNGLVNFYFSKDGKSEQEKLLDDTFNPFE